MSEILGRSRYGGSGTWNLRNSGLEGNRLSVRWLESRSSRCYIDSNLVTQHRELHMPSIRLATLDDIDVIAEFNSLLAQETEGRTLDGALLKRGVSALLGDPAKGLYFLAIDGGKPVGQLMITTEWSDWRNGNFWWIQSVYVRKEVRGTGVFRQLYEHVLTEAQARTDVVGLRLYVDRQNEAAQATYARLGMSKSEYEMFELDFVLPSSTQAHSPR